MSPHQSRKQHELAFLKEQLRIAHAAKRRKQQSTWRARPEEPMRESGDNHASAELDPGKRWLPKLAGQ